MICLVGITRILKVAPIRVCEWEDEGDGEKCDMGHICIALLLYCSPRHMLYLMR